MKVSAKPISPPRAILITGCSTGIGYVCAHGMKERGWRVFAAARKQPDVDRLSAEGLEAVRLDYTDPESIEHAVNHVLNATGGRLDALFNNGAYGQPGALEDITPEAMRAQFEANFLGWHDLTRRIIPAMRRRGAGRIVNCGSILGFIAMKYRGPYTATKHALEGYSETLRLELWDAGIRVSLIDPGPIATNFTKNATTAFVGNVDIDASAYADAYRRRLQFLESGGTKSRFKLGPEAVLDKLVHALESPKPRMRYNVTVPTHALALIKRVLPSGLMIALLRRLSDAET
ncbi:MAG: SDR family oxidoreductase [Rhodobiaceae bacterium]|nr:SDR family oxidoreductase [Rhodobiaceae bacterium]MCC0012321.1 SDR family oxidoreductase [Rhodobiaceae bacterium]MCC0051961.1 SDR family oxidoreductase [Rhodobiaceae bacterium]